MKKKLVLAIVLALLVMAMVAPVASAAPPAAPPDAPPAYGGYWYYVNYGDTLYRISINTAVPMNLIISANGIMYPNWIYAGQYLWIPPYPTTPPPPPPAATYHTVQYGENLYRISLMYGVSMWDIASANGIYNLNWIYAGQVLLIP